MKCIHSFRLIKRRLETFIGMFIERDRSPQRMTYLSATQCQTGVSILHFTVPEFPAFFLRDPYFGNEMRICNLFNHRQPMCAHVIPINDRKVQSDVKVTTS